MDPISALNVAAAAIQFIDFSFQTLALCKEIRDSTDGITDANLEFERQAKAVQAVHKELEDLTRKSRGTKRVMDQSRKCGKIAKDLLDAIEPIRKARRAKNFSEVKSVLRALKSKKTIERLENALKEQRKALDSAVTADILVRLDSSNDEQRKQIDALGERAQRLSTTLQMQQSEHHETQLRSHKKIRSSIKASEIEVKRAISRGNQSLRNEISKLDSRVRDLHSISMRKAVMQSLFFPELTERKETIKAPCQDTYSWIFDENSDEWTKSGVSNFPRWLRTGRSLYWVNGVAGSGKSTLMAHVVQNQKTMGLLKDWCSADGRELIMFSYFFWRPGTPLQKSIQGLLRSVLYQLCQAMPLATDIIAAELKLEEDLIGTWTEYRLTLALRLVLKTGQHKFCAFIDGLDEFDGDYRDLISVIRTLDGQEYIKFCVSSRPEAKLQLGLSGSAQLRLQDFNKSDIKKFVMDSLRRPPNVLDPKTQFANEIIRRARGVFLWAVIVSRSVASGLEAGEEEKITWARLSKMPPSLDALFTRVLEDMDPFYWQTFARIVQTMLVFEINTISRLAVINTTSGFMSYADWYSSCKQLENHLRLQGSGFIEIISNSDAQQACFECKWCLVHPENTLLVPGGGAILHPDAVRKECSGANDPSLLQIWKYNHAILSFTHRTVFDYFSNSDTGKRFLQRSLITDDDLSAEIRSSYLIEWVARPRPK